jgi:hypothetical protein
MENENDYSAPNGVRFKISVSKRGSWHCMECGQEGATNYRQDEDDDAESQAEAQAKEHSVMCGAGRGTT